MLGVLPGTAAGVVLVACQEESTRDGESTPTERAGLVVWALARGEGLTTEQAAQMAGMTHRGAYKLLCRLSRRLPIYLDDADVWQNMDFKELN